MEKAILKTLVYADIFNYPIRINEIHRWLIGRKVTLRQVEKALGNLVDRLQVTRQRRGSPEAAGYRGYYFLPRREVLVAQRQRRQKQSAKYFRKAKMLCQILKVIPWIKLVGISGGLALDNASKKDDIDLFVITAKNRLWISRFLSLSMLSLIGQRRKVGEKGKKIAGKLCINTLLEEDRLEQQNKDIFVAHELLQMKVLWQRNGTYSKYLSDNDWAFKFLPNWTTNVSSPPRVIARGKLRRGSNSEREVVNRRGLLSSPRLDNWIPAFAGMTMEKIAKWFQLKIMQKPKGMERIEDGALYFHPNDIRQEVLLKYEKKLKKIISP